MYILIINDVIKGKNHNPMAGYIESALDYDSVELEQDYDSANDTVSGLSIGAFRKKKQVLFKTYTEKLNEGALHLGNLYNCHSENIHALQTMINIGVYPITWPTLDNKATLEMANETQALDFRQSLFSKAIPIKNHNYNVLLVAINNATTQVELDAVDTTTGWP